MTSQLRLLSACGLFASWVVLLLTGLVTEGWIHLVLAGAIAFFPWRLKRETDKGRLESAGSPAGDREDFERPIVIMLFSVFLVEVLRNAWLADDAFITLRTVDNLLHGLGPVYNALERVQVYTHPLWMGLLSLFCALTRESYFTVLVLSLACSAAAVALAVYGLAVSRLHGIFVLVLLLSSEAFVAYSTSGLENPLTHLLLGAFALLYARAARDGHDLALLATVAGLGLINRLDTALLLLPGLLFAAWRSRRWHGLRPLALGLAPFFAWEVFSLVYYGFPFPNTAFAKLGTGVPRSELVEQGILYLVDSLYRDPVTVIVILTSSVVLAVRRVRSDLPLLVGLALYLVYLVAIGGDFMSGRFLSGPYYLAVVFLATTALSRRSILAMTAIAVALHFGALTPARNLSAGHSFGGTGIVDEKSFYFDLSGLPRVSRSSQVRQARSSRQDVGPETIELWVGSAIGFDGWSQGWRIHVVDLNGLADPLLARLPTRDRHDWRIGHFSRKVPFGYLATLRSGSNQIEDRQLAQYYDQLSLVVRGELFSWSRWRAIVGFNLGRYDHLIDRELYRQPYSLELSLRDLGAGEASAPDASPGVVLAPTHGALIRLGEVSHCSRLRLGLAGGVHYRLAYYRNESPTSYGRIRGATSYRQDVPFAPGDGIHAHEVEVPADVASSGYDALMIEPVEADLSARHRVEHVLLCRSIDQQPAPDERRSGYHP